MVMNDYIALTLTIVLAFINFAVISTSATTVLVNDNDIITVEKITTLATLQKTFFNTQEFSILEFLIKFKSFTAFGKIVTEFKNAADVGGITLNWLSAAINSFRTKVFKDLTSYCKAIEVLGLKMESLEQLNMEEGFGKIVSEATVLYNRYSEEEVRLSNLQSKAHKKYKSYHNRSQRLMESNIAKSNLQLLILVTRHCQMIWQSFPENLDYTGTFEDNIFPKLFNIIEKQALYIIRKCSLCTDHDEILNASNWRRKIIIKKYHRAFEKVFGVDGNSLIVKIEFYIIIKRLLELLSSFMNETFSNPSIVGITSISTDSRQTSKAVILANCVKLMEFLKNFMFLNFLHTAIIYFKELVRYLQLLRSYVEDIYDLFKNIDFEKKDFKVIGEIVAKMIILKKQVIRSFLEHWNYSNLLRIMSKYCYNFVSIIDRLMSILILDLCVLDPEDFNNNKDRVYGREFDAENYLGELCAIHFGIKDWVEFMISDLEQDWEELLAIDFKPDNVTIAKNSCRDEDQLCHLLKTAATKDDSFEENIEGDNQLDMESLVQKIGELTLSAAKNTSPNTLTNVVMKNYLHSVNFLVTVADIARLIATEYFWRAKELALVKVGEVNPVQAADLLMRVWQIAADAHAIVDKVILVLEGANLASIDNELALKVKNVKEMIFESDTKNKNILAAADKIKFKNVGTNEESLVEDNYFAKIIIDVVDYIKSVGRACNAIIIAANDAKMIAERRVTLLQKDNPILAWEMRGVAVKIDQIIFEMNAKVRQRSHYGNN